MKICFFVHNINGSGGDTKVAVSNINSLIEHLGCSVTVLSLENIKKYRKRSFELHPDVNVESIRHQIYHLKKEIIPLALRIKNHFKNNNYDIVVASGMDLVPFLVMSLGDLKNVRKVAWEHMNYNIGSRFSLLRLGRKIAQKYFDRIVVLSDRDKLNYLTKAKCKEKVVRIYNPMNEISDKRVYNFNSKKILSCGFLVEQKGFDIAVDIAEKVLKERPDWIWEIWGDGYQKSELEEKINNKGLDGRLILRGYADNMMSLYQDYSIFALTSRFEGFGMVLVEALQNGLPSISFDIDAGPDELIHDGENGFLVEPYDRVKFAECLIKLIDDVEMRKCFSTKTSLELNKLKKEDVVNYWIADIFNK